MRVKEMLALFTDSQKGASGTRSGRRVPKMGLKMRQVLPPTLTLLRYLYAGGNGARLAC
jgi:hypothetical protein